jgi:hypothetical protein
VRKSGSFGEDVIATTVTTAVTGTMTVTHLHAVDNPLLLKHARSQPVELELLLRIPRPHADVKRALQKPRYLQQVKD